MKARHQVAVAGIAAAIAVGFLPPGLAGQEPRRARAAGGKAWSPPHTPWGDPDLQGVWTVWDPTPLQAPLQDQTAAAKQRAARAAAEAKRAAVDEGVNPSGPDGKGTDGGL